MIPRIPILFLCLAATGAAEQLAIRITGQAQPNCWDLDDMVEGVTRGLTTDREKALALHRFGMAHIIHFNGPIEERDDYVNDPLKLIGVYGYALCGNNSRAMAALYNRAGLKARMLSLTGHAVPEVWFEGKWNYIDTDMFGYVYLSDGTTIASVAELTREPELFLKQARPPDPYFPFDEKADMARIFRNAKVHHNLHPYSSAHLMNLALRTGESATLHFRPQNRFLLTTITPRNLGTHYKDYWTVGAVRQGSLAWTDEKPAAYGNGLLEYQPDLRSEAFQAENRGRQGIVVRRERGLPALAAARPAEPAWLELDMVYPWVIVGLQNDLTNFEDDTDGAVLSGLFWRMDDSDENRISVSIDNGRTWTKVWENRFLGAVPFRVDLTRWAMGRYHYRVRLEWMDRKATGKVGIEGLKVHTWTALSPMALPRLVNGENRFQYATAPRKTYYHDSRWDRGAGLEDESRDNLAFHAQTPYLRPRDPSLPGELTFRLGPRTTVEETRLSVLLRALGPFRDVSLVTAWSEDDGRSWRPLERHTVDPSHEMNQIWFNHRVRGRRWSGASTWVKLSVRGAGLEKVIANSALATEPQAASELRITHVWAEDGEQKSSTHLAGAGRERYAITTGAGKLVNRVLRLEAVAPR